MQYDRNYSVKKTLAKDVHHKKLSGVCAGLAKYYQLPRLVVRVAAIVALITFPVAAGVAYLVSALLMSDR
ncbi:PspC domain-containing protein [Thalassomonas haliotis]|uniref:PspC domain-containing protein n=1 Tax=Thalassomonas haliotis TaxID=485448 RepID=A0ABY7VC21_9GAMM|nr:PspC domain-containing protein [Thalassomonas haliotis]WDE11098.1 PspC domain-containing protein [Thalassomonas haliotis]